MSAPTTCWPRRARRRWRRSRRTSPIPTRRRAITTSSSTAGCRRSNSVRFRPGGDWARIAPRAGRSSSVVEHRFRKPTVVGSSPTFGSSHITSGMPMKRYGAVPCSVESYRLAEGPVWDVAASRIIWVDIHAGLVLEGRLTDGVLAESARHAFDGMVGAAVPATDGSLLVAAQEHLVIFAPDGSRVDGPRVVEPGVQSRTNDGGTDPSGRFLIGTLALDDRFGAERLLRIEHDGEVTVIDDDLALSNGLAWSSDGSTLYSVDTRRNVVWERDYSPGREAPGDRRRYLTVEPGHPDGL